MRYETVWDEGLKFFFVVDALCADKRKSAHWTSWEANKKRDGLEHVHTLLNGEASNTNPGMPPDKSTTYH
jgi:hypothetical protein|tara:strand:- start:1188 stop:1397 length:210 start_codon:yes stop_codon:yes gene_type:complete